MSSSASDSSSESEPEATQWKQEKAHTPISAAHEQLLSDYYYRAGYTFGRDGLYRLLEEKSPDNHPSRRQIARWLSRQKIQQLFLKQDSGGTANRFIPTKPWQNTSIDLIDYNFNQYGKMRYIIVFIDNFSRFMYTAAIPNKEATTCAKAFKDTILAKQREEYPDAPIKTLLSDDGGEFKGEFETVLKEEDIVKRRILGGHPQQNGMVERSNGKLKMILAKNKMIRGGGWGTHLDKCRKIYNDQWNRGTQCTPYAASILTTEAEFKEVRRINEKAYGVTLSQKQKDRELAKILSVGSPVRIRLTKGALSKSSEPGWSSTVYRIGKVLPAIQSIAPRYLIEGKDQRYRYARTDLLPVTPGTQDIPKDLREEAKKANASSSAITRSLTDGAFTEFDEYGLRKGDSAENVAKAREAANNTKAAQELKKKKADAKNKQSKTTATEASISAMYTGKRVKIPQGFTKFRQEEWGDTGVIVRTKRQRYAVWNTKTKRFKLSKNAQLVYHIRWDNGDREPTYKMNGDANVYLKPVVDKMIV